MFPRTRRVVNFYRFVFYYVIPASSFQDVDGDDYYCMLELSEFDNPVVVSLPSLVVVEGEGEEATTVVLAASEPRKKDLRFTTVESSPPSQTELLVIAELSQYVEEPCSSSGIYTVVVCEFEVCSDFSIKEHFLLSITISYYYL